MLSELCFHNSDKKVDVSYSSTSSKHPVHAKYLLPEGWAQTRGVSHLPAKHLALASVQSVVNTSPLPALTVSDLFSVVVKNFTEIAQFVVYCVI